jgi:hypothetical protein
MITEKLTIEQQHEILNALFGFNYEENTSEDRVEDFTLYDERGNEFYNDSLNCNFNFSTLAGIFSYVAYRAKIDGYEECQFKMRKLIGL